MSGRYRKIGIPGNNSPSPTGDDSEEMSQKRAPSPPDRRRAMSVSVVPLNQPSRQRSLSGGVYPPILTERRQSGLAMAEEDINEEMAKIYEGFDAPSGALPSLHGTPKEAAGQHDKKYGEQDFEARRRESFPHMQHVLKPNVRQRKRSTGRPLGEIAVGGSACQLRDYNLDEDSSKKQETSADGDISIAVPNMEELRKAELARRHSETSMATLLHESFPEPIPEESTENIAPSLGPLMETLDSPTHSVFSSPTSDDQVPLIRHDVLSDIANRKASEADALSFLPQGSQEPVVSSQGRNYDTEPIVSEKAAHLGPLDVGDRKVSFDSVKVVQFVVGADGETEEMEKEDRKIDDEEKESQEVTEDDPQRKKKHRHRHHHRKSEENLQERRRRGSEMCDPLAQSGGYVLEEEGLQEQDIDEMTSHRYTESKINRHNYCRKASESKTQVYSPVHKKTYDRTPHEIFVQLDQLTGYGEDQEWKEMARWIKYEEDVEEGGNKWGRPHVASLSFHSLLELRRCLESGIVILDLEERDLTSITSRILTHMMDHDLIKENEFSKLMRLLLLRHRPVTRHDRFRRSLRRNTSSNINLMAEFEKKKSFSNEISLDGTGSWSSYYSPQSQETLPNGMGKLLDEAETGGEEGKEEIVYSPSVEDLKRIREKDPIYRRIPEGAEAMACLVGNVDFLEGPTAAFVRLAEAVVLPNFMEVPIPVRFLFILLGPRNYGVLDYHEIGRSVSTLMSTGEFHEIAYRADSRKDLMDAINTFLGDSIVLPPGEWGDKNLLHNIRAKSREIKKRKQSRKFSYFEPLSYTQLLAQQDEDDEKKKEMEEDEDDPLIRTRKPFGGIIRDIKRRYPYYVSDFRDALNSECLAAAIFIYFAALSGAITFGGLMSDKTENLIGISENMICTAVTGIAFALLAGQPLVIIATTGPLLLFDESLFSFCRTHEIDYLAIRVWIGLWLGVIATIVAGFEGSVFVRRFTRFSQEIFASLISLLFIYESFYKLYEVYNEHPLMETYCNDSYVPEKSDDTVPMSSVKQNMTSDAMQHLHDMEKKNQPNTALLSTILMLGTFFIAYFLRHFRNSKFLGRSARRALGDFGVPIAIVAMVGVDYMVGDKAYTQKLNVPEGLQPTASNVRNWLVSPLENETKLAIWMPFAAILPATLIFILLFMETHICELIIDKKERNLKKGSGLHMDIVLICLLNILCGFIGAPFVCAATVRAVSHVSALTVMSTTHAPGDKPRIVDVKEQRLTALVVSILIGISVTMASLLQYVPMAVLFGVFLYMGISSTNGIQFFERLQLILMPMKHHPDVIYVRKVETVKMHFYTFIQLSGLAVLWAVKSSQISLAFPFFLLMLIPLRKQLTCIFSDKELAALEGTIEKPDDDDDSEEELDFYEQSNQLSHRSRPRMKSY